MNLYVTDNNLVETSLGDVVMPIAAYYDITNHPYIASMKFDMIYLELDDKIPYGITSTVSKYIKVIPMMKAGKELTGNMIALLTEIYPDKASALRVNFIRNKDIIHDWIKDNLEVIYA